MSLEENRKFEERLRRIRPARVNPELSRRIERALEMQERRKRMARFRNGLGWAGAAVAASLLIGFGFLLFNGRLSLLPEPDAVSQTNEDSPPVQTIEDPRLETDDSFKPIFAENNLKNRIDEGIVFLRNGLTARRYRYEFIDRVVWENPSNGAVVEMEIPRDEVVLVPVQTF